MEEIDKLKQEVAKAELNRLKGVNATPPEEQQAIPIPSSLPTPPPIDPRTPVKDPVLDPADSLITRKVATLEVLKHLNTAKVTALISIGGLFCTSLAATFNKMWGVGAAFVFSLAIVFYLFSVVKEIKRLQQYYRVRA